MKIRFAMLLLTILSAFTTAIGARNDGERFVFPVDEGAPGCIIRCLSQKGNPCRQSQRCKIPIVRYRLTTSEPILAEGAALPIFSGCGTLLAPKSNFWREFLAVITNGGKFSQVKAQEGKELRQFWAPYTFPAFPDDLDAFENSVIFAKNVNLRSKPDIKATVVARLSYNVVRVYPENSIRKTVGRKAVGRNEFEWIGGETLSGKKGFVKSDFVRSPVDYRAGFEKRSGVWKLAAFVAGD